MKYDDGDEEWEVLDNSTKYRIIGSREISDGAEVQSLGLGGEGGEGARPMHIDQGQQQGWDLEWSCVVCTLSNSSACSRCVACHARPPAIKAPKP